MNIVRVWSGGPDRHGRTPPIALDEHLSATSDEARWLPVADVILCPDVPPCGDGESTVARTLVRHPGCLVAACRRADGAVVVGSRDGQILTFDEAEPWRAASAAHAWAVAGGRLEDLPGVSIMEVGGDPEPGIPACAGPVLLVARRAG
ncbi:hypothetical protein [Streptosporangium carneum]|uniref:Uncharacterized protein n=1 Tax=Streptosporangium carneum TaxID=47481 RepID=A0A9W6IAI6_9ACTN|nr:hypothetical protein [Streptosporangium carneum]GLK14168.1 hypothetical protein GCM10017600_75800 [Streptosporangium carneum]